MAEIINYNPEDNPRLNQIYEILLVAGYFRIRIASLKAFDKVIGGIAWCITSSNFSIQVEYNDEMQIGQKIKVSEKICQSLIKMKCPYDLQPFQLQGLDVNNIFPMVQWLVKFVYETRWQRQKYDRELSMLLGKPLTKLQNVGNPQKIPEIPIKRTRINHALVKTSYTHPLRVYSALLEYNDATAQKMYHKLLNMISSKKKNDKKNENSVANYLIEEDEQQSQQGKSNSQMNQFSGVDKLSLNKLQKIIEENKDQLEKAVKEDIGNEEDNISSLRQNLGIKVQNLGIDQQSIERNESDKRTKQENVQHPSKPGHKINDQQKILKQAKIANDKFMQKIDAIQHQIQSFESIQAKLDIQLAKLQRKHEKANRLTSQEIEKNDEYRQFQRDAKSQLSQQQNKVNRKLQKLVQKRQQLKIRKTQIKKKAKAKIQQLQYEKSIVEASIPQIDEEAFTEMMKEAEIKKNIYTKKYQQLTLVNQQLAILQRKAEKYTSAPEIAQYHQRFIELFQSINVLIEQKRSYFSQMQNLEATKKMMNNYLQIMNNMKDGYRGLKKKNQLKDLIENTSDIVQGLQANLKNSQITLAKVQSKRQSVYGELMDLIKLERQYLTLLRQLKLQYENVTKIQK